MQAEACSRGCGRQTVPKDNLSRAICRICQSEIDSGKVVWRNGLLIDLPDELRRYDKLGEVKVAFYAYKGRPRHTDPADAPEVTWKQFVEHLLHGEDFYGSWNLWVFRKPDAKGGGAGICMDTSTRGSGHVYVKISGGRL